MYYIYRIISIAIKSIKVLKFNEQDPDAIFIFLNVLQVPPIQHMQRECS